MTEIQEACSDVDERAALTARGDVMVVDDQPANLKLMEDMLRHEGYGVRSFPRGRLALTAAAQRAPDLILLDVNMPEMDGFEVCMRLKAEKKLASIPVIFLSALNETEDKMKAFRAGGVDYITKPFQFEEVQARVETQLGLQRARRAERDLLENTLNGAVRTLADLVHQTGPALAARSEAIRNLVVHMASRMKLDEPWQYELAAIMCLIGCVAIPAEAFERAYGRVPKGSDEEMFRAHPENGARLLAKIPRLDVVSEMIRRQPTAGGESLPEDAPDLGACILRIAVELDRRMFGGLTFRAALAQLKAIPRGFPRELMEALEDCCPPLAAFELRKLQVHDLRVSMITEEDIVTTDGTFMILRKGSVLNATTVEKIMNFDKTRGICQPIRVQVPQAVRS
jgi:DNA-binding response OmpR family regulator